MKLLEQDVLIRGTPICRGIAIGKPYFFHIAEETIPDYSIKESEIEGEIERYHRALNYSMQDVKRLQKQLENEKALEGAAILDAHLQMMQDPLITIEVENGIRKQHKNAESVFQVLISKYQRKFTKLSDAFFRERFKDIQDMSRRILSYLRKGERPSLGNVPYDSIVFAKEVTASDAAEAKSGCVCAFVTNTGGFMSHAAIVSKAKGIPYVASVDIDFDSLEFNPDALVIIDGRTGDVILNPTQMTLTKYRDLQQQLLAHFRNLEKAGARESETYDGYKVRLSANIEMLNELEMVHQYGGSGIGLFRSEYIFLAKDTFPSEEEQFTVYRRLVKSMQGLPIVFRTFDVGGDKFTMRQGYPQEGNPFLGCRAIRFLLKEREIFKTQLRAILRASAYGDVSIMFPLISALSELIEAKKMIQEAEKDLRQAKYKIADKIRIGCMIEVPSAAIIADMLAKECDFLSIGTNDLVQYSLAVDRSSQAMSNLYTPTHPGVIRLIKLVVNEANHHNISVNVCGEIAADPRFTSLLLGLGVHELSVASRYIPVIKNAIRSTSIVDATRLADDVLNLSNAHDILDLLSKEYQKNVPDDLFFS